MKRKQPDTQVEYEFLPSALEIVETPVSPLSRWVLWLIIAFLVLAIGWMFVGRIDEVAVARGKVVPAGNSRVIQAQSGGVITKMYVQNGQKVKKGDPLVSFDAQDEQSEVARFESLIASAELEKALLKDVANGQDVTARLASKQLTDEAKQNVKTFYTARQFALDSRTSTLQNTASQQQVALNSERQALHQKSTEIANTKANIDTLKKDSRLTGVNREITLRNAQTTLARLESEYAVQQARVRQLELSLQSAQQAVSNASQTQEASDYSVIIEQDKKLIDLRAALKKAKNALKKRQLVAPIDGVVHAAIVKNDSGVVSATQPLLTIVPEGAKLIVEAKLANKDVGFVEVGDKVAVKVDTYSFQRYGTVEGTVIAKSADAIDDETLGAVYLLEVAVDANLARDHAINLAPGMTVTAEIKTGNKRIVDFFLDPILKKTDEALKVR